MAISLPAKLSSRCVFPTGKGIWWLGRAVASLIVASCGCGAHLAQAQAYGLQYRPPSARYYVLKAPHFDVIYQEGLAEEAASAAATLEESLPKAQQLVGLRHAFHMPVVLNGFNDRSNGYVTPFPFKQEIEGVRIKGNGLSTRFDTWIEAVAPHELMHAVHADVAPGFGVGGILRVFSPDLARSINLLTPAGITEGVAVYLESRVRPHAGRLHHALFLMQQRAASAEDPWTLAQMLEAPAYSRPFDRHYIGGGRFFEFMAEQDDGRFFRRTTDFYNRFPFLGYGAALWYGTGRPPWTLARRVRDTLREEERARQATLGPLTVPTVLASAAGLVHRRPRWLDDETLVAYVQGYNVRPGFYRIDANLGNRTLLSYQRLTEDQYFSLSEDRTTLYFARYVPDALVTRRDVADVFALELGTRRVRRLTHEARTLAPTPVVEQGLWGLRNQGEFNQIVRVRADGVVPVTRLGGTAFQELLPSPDGRTLAVLLNVRGHQGIFRLQRGEAGEADVVPWLLFETASILDASWSTDGRYLLFSADLDRVANVYAYEVAEDRIVRLTNAPYGAFEGVLSPDGRAVAYINYRHERYELARVPFAPARATEVPRSLAAFGQHATGSASLRPRAPAPAPDEVQPYRALDYLAPRLIYPTLYYDAGAAEPADVALGFGGGLGLQGVDPLQQWAYGGELFYLHKALWGRLQLATGRLFLRPALRLFREPSTRLYQRTREDGEVDTLRVGREARGIGLDVRFPWRLNANVYQTNVTFSLGTEWLQERLFDADNTSVTPFRERLRIRPEVSLAYHVQSNVRDLVPNTGLVMTARGVYDVSAGASRARAVMARVSLYLPLLAAMNGGLRLAGGVLMQNQGAIFQPEAFAPRGYETLFLGRGTFLRYGLEYTQPLWFIDDGSVLLPVYFQALFAYGFAETAHAYDDWSASARYSSAGVGMGLQVRLFYAVNLELRLGAAYRFRDDRWVDVVR